MRLENNVAIVTGGGTGIGKGIAIMFAKEGAHVVVCGRRAEPLKKTVDEIHSSGGTASLHQADVSKLQDMESVVKSVLDAHGRVDILVNCAGVYVAHDALGASEDEWNDVINIDLKGTWVSSKSVLPHMLKAGKGKIVNIASIAGLIGFEQSAAYCAAKGGVINLTREMALDYSAKGIGINAIAPGVIESDMTKGLLSDTQAKQSFLSKTPIGRIGKPEDIAYAAVYLASNESDFVVGQTLAVDGGWTIR